MVASIPACQRGRATWNCRVPAGRRRRVGSWILACGRGIAFDDLRWDQASDRAVGAPCRPTMLKRGLRNLEGRLLVHTTEHETAPLSPWSYEEGIEMRRCTYVAADGKQCLYDAYWVITDCKRKHSVHAYACPPPGTTDGAVEQRPDLVDPAGAGPRRLTGRRAMRLPGWAKFRLYRSETAAKYGGIASGGWERFGDDPLR
jgi:hypothetical protein